MAKYEYEPLDAALNIRLLVVYPGREEDCIVCSLRRTTLNAGLRYIALSYTWGNSKDRRQITVDGHRLSVTANLHSALRRMRWCGDPRPLWTDAICINQEDVQERESQVGIMGQIYKQAECVIADIGEDSPDSELGYDHGRKVYEALTKMDTSTRITSFDDYESYGLPPLSDVGWNAWSRLLTRPWFSRLWIIQEYALPSDVVMLCGKRPFSYNNIPRTVTLMHKFGVAEYDRPIVDLDLKIRATKSSQRILALSVLRRAIADGDRLELLWLLRFVRGVNVTDQKDIVYGLLGLATDAGALQIRVDYSGQFSAYMLYRETTRSILQRYNKIDLLSDAERLTPRPGLPSWVADWSQSPDAIAIGLIRNTLSINSRAYDASGTSKPVIGFEMHDRLVVRGLTIDGITVAGPLMHVPSSAEGYSDGARWRNLCTWEYKAREIMSTLNSYPTEPCVLDAYWRTLIANKTIDGTKPGPEFYDAYQAAFYKPLVTKEDLDFAAHPPSLLGTIRFQVKKLFRTDPDEGYLPLQSRPYVERMGPTVAYRRFGTTNKGYMGMFPAQTQVCDVIAIIYGARTPFVIRPTANGYHFIGECYVHGIMDGEAMIKVDPDNHWEDIALV